MGRSRGNLPAELDAFVGRAEAVAALGELVGRARLVTVTGVGGVGKTRLALHTAADAVAEHPDGVWLVELAGLRDPVLVEHAVAEALRLTDHSARSLREVLAGHLAERRLLLVLDGVEHLLPACAGLVRHLLRRAPGLRVLAVSRRPLDVEGEHLFPLDPLSPGDAVALFTARAAARLPGFGSATGVGSVADGEAVAAICRRLDGIPLALELAAGRLPGLSPRQLLDRLDDRMRILESPRHSGLARHRTLRTAIGWSHELCTPEERLLWCRLSVFTGSFDLEAAEYVCAGPGLSADRVLDVLHELLAQSVLVREEAGDVLRYRMLDTVRAYGGEWLVSLGDAERMRRRHRDWFLGLATWCELDWFGPRQAEVAARIEAELPNLRTALAHCLTEPEDAHLGQYLAGTLWFYWVGCGRLAEGRHWLDRAVALESGHDESRLKALWVLGYVAVLQGGNAAATAALYECREEAERTGNTLALAYAEHRIGCLALLSDEMPRAERLLTSALDRYDTLGELNSNVLMARAELAMTYAFQGRQAAAVALCEEIRDACADRGERWALSYALYVLAFAAWSGGEHERARELLGACLAGSAGFNDVLAAVLSLELLALVTVSEGDAAEAALLQGAAGRMWERVGPPLFGSFHFGAPHATCERRAVRALGRAGYEERLREGRRLDLGAVVERALAGRPAPGGPVALPGPAPVPHTRRPADSPTGKGGEAAGRGA
ncbi:ATP-binding protein [Streptomyces sp. NPDC060194]|uniref:ATP-binding protein n=1 Tax=Streptomyces sp. NPDC060194 TaxID=3347069 RepID=UPI00364A48ED